MMGLDPDKSHETIAASCVSTAGFSSMEAGDADKCHRYSPRNTKPGPIWIRSPTLICFFFVFLACAVALVVLDRVIQARNGLALTLTANHYSWTFGPTAILVVLLSFWRQVDYCLKAVQPWWEMAEGPAPAAKTVLLDYVSPFLAISCFKAFRNRHYAVSSSIIAFTLMKLIILVSTTLFVLAPSSEVQHVPISYKNTFHAPNLSHYAPGHTPGVGGMSRPVFADGTGKLAWLYLATLNDATPHNSLAFQEIDLAEARSSNMVSLSASVDLFQPKIVCEAAEISSVPSDSPGSLYQVDSVGCKTRVRSRSSWGYAPYAEFIVFRMDCLLDTNTMWTTPNSSIDLLSRIQSDPEITSDIRYFFSIGNEKRERPKKFPTPNDAYTAVVCKFHYRIVPVVVKSNLVPSHMTLQEPAWSNQSRHIGNFSDLAMMELVFSGLSLPEGDVVVDKELSKWWADWKPSPMPALVQLMAAYLEESNHTESVFEPTVFGQAVEAVVEGVATEYARSQLLLPDAGSISTTMVEGEVITDRLFVQHASLWIMVASFVLLAILCVLLQVLVSKAAISPMITTGSIASHAVVLANSPSVMEALTDARACNAKELRHRLTGINFVTEGSKINASRAEMKRSCETSSACGGWVPFATKTPMIWLTLTSPMLCIVFLEILQRLSDSEDGLMDLPSDSSQITFALIRAASSLTLFGIVTLFNNIDFTILALAPYTRLMEGNVEDGGESLVFAPQGMSPVLALLKSFRGRHFGVTVSNCASLVGGFLTIAASGLWLSTPPLPVNTTVTASVEAWDITWAHNVNEGTVGEGGAAQTLNIIRHDADKIPSGIWGDVVIPKITSLHGPISENVTHAFLVDVLRPTFECTALPSDAIQVKSWMNMGNNSELGTEDDLLATVVVDAPAPENCYMGYASNHQRLRFEVNRYSREQSRDVWSLPLWFGVYSDLNHATDGEIGAECPTVGIVMGGIGDELNPGKGNLTALVCRQGIDVISTNITYKGDPAAAQVDMEHPPDLTTTVLPWRGDPNSTDTGWGFRVGEFLNLDLSALGNDVRQCDDSTNMINRPRMYCYPETTNANNSEVPYFVDPFFENIVNGPNFSVNQFFALEGNSEERVQMLTEAVTQSYLEYMRLVIHFNFRPSNSPEFPSDAGNGNTERNTIVPIQGRRTTKVRRLAMHHPSKILLQALLGSMFVLGAGALALCPTRGVLPREPGSIASVMAFLAGSPRLLEIAKKATEDAAPTEAAESPSPSGQAPAPTPPPPLSNMTEKQLETLFSGHVYSLGWWDDGHLQEPAEKEGTRARRADVTGVESGSVSTSIHSSRNSSRDSTETMRDSTETIMTMGRDGSSHDDVETDIEANAGFETKIEKSSSSTLRFGIDVGTALTSGFDRSPHTPLEAKSRWRKVLHWRKKGEESGGKRGKNKDGG